MGAVATGGDPGHTALWAVIIAGITMGIGAYKQNILLIRPLKINATSYILNIEGNSKVCLQ
jgi:hypothetical protein